MRRSCVVYVVCLGLGLAPSSQPSAAQRLASALDSTALSLSYRGGLLEQRFVYDPRTQLYLLTSYVAGQPLGEAVPYTREEYLRLRAQWGEARYWAELNKEGGVRAQGFDPLSLRPQRVSAIDRAFGPGGLQLTLQGSVELRGGVRSVVNPNPLLSQRARRREDFDFGEQIQASLDARLGTRLGLKLHYNSSSTFSVDSRQLRLRYEGREDDILRFVELGQVQLQSRNRLIHGGGSALGLRAQMQLGRLTADLLVSQQRSQLHTLQTQGGVQTQEFSCRSSDYDASRHFFLSGFFRARYEEALRQLPHIRSAVRITRVELWVTNRRGDYSASRSLLALAQLADPARGDTQQPPHNEAGLGYRRLSALPQLRMLGGVETTLAGTGLRASWDYEALEHARRLEPSEYTLQPELGYISLKTALAPDEVLAAAFEYSYEGRIYRVGDFARGDVGAQGGRLFVSLLKGTEPSPETPYGSLMMRNVYRIGSGTTKLEPKGFELEINYQDAATGLSLPYLSEGPLKGQTLRSLLGLDRLDRSGVQRPDGHFDFVEGYTVRSSEGLIIFPTLEPFGKTLEGLLGSEPWKGRYSYPELYSQTKAEAARVTAKDRYQLRVRYEGRTLGELDLGRREVDPESLRLRAAGQELKPGVDYLLDASAGKVRILNQQLLESNTPIEVSLQGAAEQAMTRRNLVGLELNYELSKQLKLGATLMHLSEQPGSSRLRVGQELLRNTMWGAHLSYEAESMRLTDWLNKLSWGHFTVPSRIQLTGQFAQLHAGTGTDGYDDGASSLDDFEQARSGIDLMNPMSWHLAATPVTLSPRLGQGLAQNGERALLSWFSIDPIFSQHRSSQTPAYIRNNPDLVSNHFVRDVLSSELYPYREQLLSQASYLPTLSLSYYPRERGPYNLNAAALTTEGYIAEPERSWAGITRRVDQTDFDQAGIDYLECWLMDPFVYEPTARGGSLFINLGEISEDVLPDGYKAYENGLPLTDDPASTRSTLWGRVSTQPSVGYSFATSAEGLRKQDVGLDGLASAAEQSHPSYGSYLAQLRSRMSAATLSRWGQQPMSPLRDPAGDDFHHYRGSDYDAAQLPILERYKYYNGTEGNSTDADYAASASPDTEDINRDNSLNEANRYYEYEVKLSPEALRVGQGFVVGERKVDVQLRNGQTSEVRWYQLRIPLQAPTRRVGGIEDWRSIRFMRLYLRGFDRTTQLRFGALRLMRGDWRAWQGSLGEEQGAAAAAAPSVEDGGLLVSSVNIEEHGDRRPINYVSPPTSARQLGQRLGQSQLQNEQALSLKLRELEPQQARAVYRSVQYDLRRYGRLQLFVHAEQLLEQPTDTQDDELQLFLRLGSDYTRNYYEYSLPLKLTAPGRYANELASDRARVWPLANMIDLALEQLPQLKQRRNALAATRPEQLYRRYSEPDPEHQAAQWSVLGNPSLAHVRSLMIGVRNRSGQVRSAEIWVNELRAKDYSAPGGWAGSGQLGLQLSDLGTANVRAHYQSAGFGAIDQARAQQSLESRKSLSLSLRADLGKLLPQGVKLRAPIYYALNSEEARPEYASGAEDLRLSEVLDAAPTEAERHALLQRNQRGRSSQSLSLTGLRLEQRSRKAMPYDPANLSLSFMQNSSQEHSPETEYRRTLDWQGSLNYDYSPSWEAWRPFRSLSGAGAWRQFLRQYGLKLWPEKLSLQTSMQRHYDEEQLRSITPQGVEPSALAPSWSQLFLWNRRLDLSWTPLTDLHLSLQAGTDTRIEEPHRQVNRQLDPDGWRVWRDSVLESIAAGGTPLHYGQQTSLSWQLPTTRIAPLSFLTGQLSYHASYTWDRGTLLPLETEQLSNSLSNEGSTELQLRLQLRKLYQQIPYLRRLEQRYGSSGSGKPQGVTSWLDRLVYTLLMPRELSLHWRHSQHSLVTGYLPLIGSLGGQVQQSSGGLSPGLPFALGLSTLETLEQLARRGELVADASYARPPVYSLTRSLDLKATLQPLRDLTITLTANHTRTERTELQYYYPEAPRLYGGDFTMTTIGLRGFFAQPRLEAGYRSASFERFLDYRARIAARQHARSPEPLVQLEANDPAVLIPAFRAAYGLAGGAEGVSLEALPGLGSLLPNWNIYYSGLSRLPLLSRYLRSVVLRHAYRGVYTVGAYNSFGDWQGTDPDGLGLRPQTEGRAPRLSYAYDLGSVALQESFFPLIGLDLTWLNGLGLSTQWRRSRGLVLGLSAQSIVETFSDELALDLGYKVADLTELLRPGRSRRRSPRGAVGRGLILKSYYSYQRSLSLIRRIEELYTQSLAATDEHRLRFSAEYELSSLVSLRAYYEWTRSRSQVSSYAFPITLRSYGLSLRLSLPSSLGR
ncbi:cell surface protein SprA [Porphyromonas sp. oral taxon 275]|uniref:T9SS outer membrane translocon Sov/SprA n=1 Tax=Porphyromonas sp. oral taxon 275 TaxID=712435 RepID=UPI002011FA13|nr:cell surface protein SprA [Porphyromonas sp. oral taxon 275]